MKKYYIRYTLLFLSMILLPCSGCSKSKATTMRLTKTEGTVSVADSKGKNINPTEDLMLYSGYSMETDTVSYAWINLDSVKLAKMDEKSEIEIKKDGKALDIQVNSGSMFFHVTEPLADDETMEIRTSTMTVGIRGTCGWVEVPDENHMKVYILEGKVTCSIDEASEEQTAADVSAWEMAEMGLTEDGKRMINVKKFTESDVPDFAKTELNEENLNNRDLTENPVQGEEESEEVLETDGSLELEDYVGSYTCDEKNSTLVIYADGSCYIADQLRVTALAKIKIKNGILITGYQAWTMTPQGGELIVEGDAYFDGTYHR